MERVFITADKARELADKRAHLISIENVERSIFDAISRQRNYAVYQLAPHAEVSSNFLQTHLIGKGFNVIQTSSEENISLKITW